jgi:chemosensory pili system protein ChpA (sensor histidine kinase/response regulator)
MNAAVDMQDDTHAALQLVVGEIAVEMNEARAALEVFLERPEDRAALQRFARHLHLARGALRVVGVHGGALLAEEMEQVARYLDAHSGSGQAPADDVDALLRAMEQLPAYVDRVASGGRDVPLALLPLLNDLRAVRGGALLSEGTLLLLNLRSDEPARPAVDDRSGQTAPELARRLRPRLQVALLGWIRGEQLDRNLAELDEIAGQIEAHAGTQPLFQLWWVVGAVLEALRQGGIDGNVSVKRLLGQADRELRRLQELGEAAYASAPPVELLNNLLFYVARSKTAGPRVASVRKSFRLEEVLAASSQPDEASEALSAPSVRLMHTVAAAIREDLTRVKDVLDIFVRKGATQVDELVPQLEMLRKISDTLGVLGLGELRDRVLAETGSLEAIVEGRLPAEDAVLLGIAAALIKVEDSLHGQLVRLILPDAGSAAPAPVDEEFRQVRAAVLRECVVNMARIKDAIALAAVSPSEAQGFDQVPQLVRGITAGLLMLEESRAVEIMDRLGRVLSAISLPELGSIATPRLDHLAEAIVAVEYYMELLQEGRSDPGRMLDTAEQALSAVRPPAGKVVVLRPARPEGEPAAAVVPVAAEPDAPAPAAAAVGAGPVPAVPPAAPAVAGGVEPEFVRLFVEEARENFALLQSLYPQWQGNALDTDALRDLRRIFHTLKGSGRMVGAQRIVDLAWGVESLLNKVISQTLPRSAEIVELLGESVELLPRLIDALEQGRPETVDPAALVARAAVLAGRAPPARAEAAGPQALPAGSVEPVAPVEAEAGIGPSHASGAPPPVEAGPPEAPAVAMDPVLRDIFRKETTGHVAVVREYIGRSAQSAPPHPITEAVYRACHTLSGIAKTAGARQGIKVAEPMEHYVRKLHDSGHGLPGEGLALLRDTVRCLESVVENIDDDTGCFPDQGRLIAGWHVLERALDAELAQLAEAAERTVAAAWSDAGAEAAPAVSVIGIESPSAPLATEAPAAVEPLAPPEAPEADPEFDADIAAIFGEEAGELLERADATLLQWSRDCADRAHVTELKRLLHTLKGGARMAGLRSMGNLSHQMETLVAEVEAGRVISEADAVAVLQASLDELHRMREAAGAGQRVAPAVELIERARSVVAAVATETSVAVPPTVAPFESGPDAGPDAGAEAGPEAVAVATVEAVEQALVEPVPEQILEPGPACAAEPAVEAAAGAVPEVLEVPEEAPFAAAPVLPAAPDEAPAASAAAVAEAPFPAPAFRSGSPAAVPPSALPGREPPPQPERHELARVAAELLDELLNNAGEVSIYRARVEQQMTSVEFNLVELGRTVTRLREQLRKLEMETEAQILFKHQGDAGDRADFDPLELDRYSTIQQLSRALAESASDVASIEGLLGNLNREAQNLLQQQGRVVADLQGGLMRTRMIPFQRHAQRLTRLVRQAALEADKQVELSVEGGSGEIDRQVLERMLPPFEHMLRNAVVHGIEPPSERCARGKPETGRIAVSLQREGADVLIVVEDDGAGINVEAVRSKARHTGLLPADHELTDEEALQLILEPGFSTADRLTQQAGRGVGMDVVATEVKKLGGGLFIESEPGRGTRFTIRLPFTLALTQALVVRVHDEHYALPVATVEGVARLPRAEVERHLAEEQPTFEYAGQVHRFQHLATFLGAAPTVLPETDAALPVILVRAGERSAALVTDELVGSREIVLKSVGPQIASIRGIAGATILGDGRIVIILDVGALVRSEWRSRAPESEARPARDDRIFAMVVDDSITVRRVTQRLLERNGMRVLTANDGIEALSLLQEHVPDVILLDIEMPRMDGYEVAAHVRGDPRLADVPIIMITSRVGEKHRARAIEIGVDDYLGKPYQESQLLDAVEALVLARRAQPL